MLVVLLQARVDALASRRASVLAGEVEAVLLLALALASLWD